MLDTLFGIPSLTCFLGFDCFLRDLHWKHLEAAWFSLGVPCLNLMGERTIETVNRRFDAASEPSGFHSASEAVWGFALTPTLASANSRHASARPWYMHMHFEGTFSKHDQKGTILVHGFRSVNQSS